MQLRQPLFLVLGRTFRLISQVTQPVLAIDVCFIRRSFGRLQSVLTFQKIYALFTSNRCSPVLPDWILKCSLLMFRPIARRMLWASAFFLPR